jgi:aspartyl-tRNA(Asn)/glutamyl-tRNA(Gln) amidotransferase subunit B
LSDTAWEVVIGMEVHAQPRTRSKMFCGCAIAPLNAAPNTHVCEICAGMPGVLPVINRAAVEACLKTALALECEIPTHTKFDRKNYMYPDLPKGYQISQYDLPMSRNGKLEVGGRTVRIRRVHLEEDTGKLVHAGDALHKAWESYVDLNRAGVPLMEIVSEPDLRSAEEARDYAMELQAVLRAIGASDADMEKGQMRVEPNVSLRRAGREELGEKTELKNINSFRALYRAVSYEIKRQAELLDAGGKVEQETRGWSEAEQRTFKQRSKEFAEDYRYFPEPDLPPLSLERRWIESLRAALPELPSVRRSRFVEQYALPATVAAQISADPALAELLDRAVAAGAGAASTASWIINEASVRDLPPEHLAEIDKLVSSGQINRDQGREVIGESLRTHVAPAVIVSQKGLAQVSDTSVLEPIAREVIAANSKAAADYRSGKEGAIGPLLKDLVGRAPQADRRVARELLQKLLG